MTDISPKEKKSNKKLIVVCVVVGAAISIPYTIRAFLFEAFKIPAASMIPTLQVGDHIFINKRDKKPRKGEVVVFVEPEKGDKDFIKRIVATEGDQIEFKKNVIYLNGKPISRRELKEKCEYEDYDPVSGEKALRKCKMIEETLGTTKYKVIQDSGSMVLDNDMPMRTIPSGHFFVLGDNRDNSMDSRFFGPVPNKNLKGKLSFVWWSSGAD